MTPRENIYAALFALVASAPGLVTTSRKLLHWNDVKGNQMPALFQAQGTQIAMPVTGRPTRWDLGATLWLYFSTQGTSNPGAVANPIVDAVMAKFDLNHAGLPQTLGGLVHYARIEGTVETSEGTLGDKEVVRIPIRMLTA